MYKFSLKSGGGGGKHICQRILLINEPEAKKYSKLCSWILRTFPTRSKSVMPAFYKSLVIPHLDYGSQSLWSPFKVTQINILEKIQHCIVLYCIMRPYTDGPIRPLSYRHSSGVVRNPHSTLAE